MTAAKRVMRYIKGNNYWISYNINSAVDLEVFSDATWGAVFESKSIGGWLVKAGGSVVSYNSKMQKSTALSTTESELIALSEAAKEIVYMRKLSKDLGIAQVSPTMLRVDNNAAITLAKTEGHHERTKHINIRYHFVRELVADNVIDIEHVGTDDQTADILTKSLPVDKHLYHTTEMLVKY
jgi:hypothetical protein